MSKEIVSLSVWSYFSGEVVFHSGQEKLIRSTCWETFYRKPLNRMDESVQCVLTACVLHSSTFRLIVFVCTGFLPIVSKTFAETTSRHK
ncbi:hypothetical protein TNIN_386751 [Trichonephila inaurata madagascariensis]|uniref:Uncharacterized protein n=1 Tax=Trichonephila inaurata madagascariensis TaxID=2747483 RepID=A0A8X6MLT7_9ARAC|nr:hypothetical protein TNIN_386751 [Trichonephila inaurata madagascariensis]